MANTLVAIVGCGKVAHIHAKALRSIPDVELTAVCDASAERAGAFASEYGARGFSELTTMLREGRPQAVLICTPHPLHAAPAIEAAQAGVHVLVEKPLAATLADCDAMLAAARKAGIQLGVISQRRLYEPVQRMRQAWPTTRIALLTQ